jgi:uroporphyrinogen III methyltransferase / synthase
LKGGDPFIFGRGGEEAEALAQAGVPFEIIPGVSSGVAAPAYAGIPLTHRELASSVCFIAGQENPSKAGSLVDWQCIAGSNSTLAFFMGTRNLAAIARALVARGRTPATPVAVIRWGTRPEQEVILGTLADIAERARTIEPPTVIVVGEVARLRERLRWFERLPLFGRRIVVTRAREQAASLRDSLEERGAAVVEIPAIEFRPPASWAPLDDAIRRLGQFDYLLVTSVNGVRNFVARLEAADRDARNLKGLTIGAIGPATAAEFAKCGVRVDFVPREYRAEGLVRALSGRDLRGRGVLIPRAKVARDLVPKALEERGARVEVVVAYETVPPSFAPGELESLLSPPPDAFTFTSSSTAAHLVRLLTIRKLEMFLKRAAIGSIGPVTSTTLRGLGFPPTFEARESTMRGLVEALEKHFLRDNA